MHDPQALTETLERNLSVLRRQAGGLTQAETLVSVVEGGSHLNWLLGHLVGARDGMLRALGREGAADERTTAPYRKGGAAPGPDAAVPSTNLLATLEVQQARLAAALAEAGEEALASPAKGRDGDVGTWLAFLVWHESYHVGQATLYRRLAGRASELP